MAEVNKSFFFCLLSVTFAVSSCMEYWTVTESNHVALAETTASLACRFLTKYSTTIVIIESTFEPRNKDLNTRILDYVLHNLGNNLAVQLYYGQSENQPWEYHIFIVDSDKAFLGTNWNSPKSNFERDFRFLIVLTEYTEDYYAIMNRIFQFCYRYRVLNVNVLLNHKLHGVCMYKYELFTESSCRVVKPSLYFQFKDGFENLLYVFPNKLENFHGCPLKVVGRVNQPLLTFSGKENNVSSRDRLQRLGGIDGYLIKLVAKNLNFKIDLLPFPKSRSYFDNRTGFGCFELLLNNEADIAIGGLSASHPNRVILTISILYHQSPVVIVVRGGRELDCVNRLGRPFKFEVWNMIVFLLLTVAVAIHMAQFLKPSIVRYALDQAADTPTLNFLAIFLGYPITRLPIKTLGRIILVNWLLMTLVLRNAYQGSLYDSIRIDRFEKIPQRFDHLVKSRYKILESSYYRDLAIFPSNRTILVQATQVQRLRMVEKLVKHYATVVLRDHYFNYLEKNARRGCDLTMIHEQLYLFQFAWYFQKHSVYASTINNHLRKLMNTGLIGRIVRHNLKSERFFKDDMKSAPLKRLTNDRIWSMYQLYMGLVGVTVAVFVLELISKYIKKLRVVMNRIHE